MYYQKGAVSKAPFLLVPTFSNTYPLITKGSTEFCVGWEIIQIPVILKASISRITRRTIQDIFDFGWMIV
jgi:hypothetical protein